jgi:hypothetical protein
LGSYCDKKELAQTKGIREITDMLTRTTASMTSRNERKARPGEAGEVSSETGVFQGILDRWLKACAPFGYQDETGFHFGLEPARSRIGYPSHW